MSSTITWVFIQYFADRDIFCAGRVTEEDLQRVAAATGGTVQTSVNNVINEVFSEQLNHKFVILFFSSSFISILISLQACIFSLSILNALLCFKGSWIL